MKDTRTVNADESKVDKAKAEPTRALRDIITDAQNRADQQPRKPRKPTAPDVRSIGELHH